MYDIVYIFRGMLIGLMVSVPLGPMGVLIIQKTLHNNPFLVTRLRAFICLSGLSK